MKGRLKSCGSLISCIIYKLTQNVSDDKLFAFIKKHPVLINREIRSTERQLEKCNINLDELEKSRFEIRARIDEQLKRGV